MDLNILYLSSNVFKTIKLEKINYTNLFNIFKNIESDKCFYILYNNVIIYSNLMTDYSSYSNKNIIGLDFSIHNFYIVFTSIIIKEIQIEMNKEYLNMDFYIEHYATYKFNYIDHIRLNNIISNFPIEFWSNENYIIKFISNIKNRHYFFNRIKPQYITNKIIIEYILLISTFSGVQSDYLTLEIVIYCLKKKNINNIPLKYLSDKTVYYYYLKYKLEKYNGPSLHYIGFINSYHVNKVKNVYQFKYYNNIIKEIPQEMINDKNIVLLIISHFPKFYSYLTNSTLLEDDDIIDLALSRRGMNYTNLPLHKKTFENTISAVYSNGLVLEYVEEKYKNNLEIVTAAVNQNGEAIKYVVNYKFKRNYELVKSAVSNNGRALKYLKYYCNDYNIVHLAVSNYGSALEYASNELKNNEEIVFTAIQQHKKSFYYASDRIQNMENFISMII